MLRNMQAANALQTLISEFILSYILMCISRARLPCLFIDTLKPGLC